MKKILSAYGIPENVVEMIMRLYNGSKAHVMTADGPSDDFEISAGILQRDTLAPFFRHRRRLDWVLRNATEEAGGGVGFSLKQNSGRSAEIDNL